MKDILGRKSKQCLNQLQEIAIYPLIQCVRFVKGEVFLHESAVCLIAPLQKAAIILHHFCFKMFKAKAGQALNQIQAEDFVRGDGSDEERIDNQNRFFTDVAKMPINENFYIALISKVFKQCICDELGPIHECHVSQNKSLKNSFESFGSQNVPKIVYDSDEKREAQRTQKLLPQKSENIYWSNSTQGFDDKSKSNLDVSNSPDSFKIVLSSPLLNVFLIFKFNSAGGETAVSSLR